MSKNRHKDRASEDKGAAATAKQDEFAGEINSARRHAEELRRQVSELSPVSEEVVLRAVEELRTTLEELQVVHEELRQQNEELLTTRSALEAERIRYEDLFESSPDGYLVTDKNGVIRQANGAAATMLGVKQRFLARKPLSSYVAESDRTAFRNELAQLSTSESPLFRKIDLRLRPRGIKPLDVSLRVTRVVDNKGRLTELHWTMRDITERKRAQEEVQQLNAQLEEKVRQRTAELEQANVLKDELLIREQSARKEAEHANLAKDEFLALVSHELRTPLNAIMGWAQMLRSNLSDEAQRAHAAEVIERSARVQAQMINDILDVSRVVNGNLPLDIRPLDLTKVIEAATEDARPAINAKGISLSVSLDKSGLVYGDALRLQQVVANLLSNSIKFTPPGGAIEVRHERAGDNSRITVSDTGHGINAEFLPYVFDRFRQADSHYTRQQGGLGLGLAIVKVLVDMHGGTVSAASDGEGKGSTFTVTLPVASEREVPAKQVPDSEPAVASERPERLAGLWIVAVDDDLDAREMMRAKLEACGARVTTCASCAEALALFIERSTASLTQKRPDVLVTDLAMPGEDGFDLIRAIRSLEPHQGGTIPAIALTAYTGDETRARAIDEGFQAHLTKPLQLEELVQAIAALAATRLQPNEI